MLDPVAARSVLASSDPPRKLLNGYGPTESTTFATCHEVLLDDVVDGVASVPIGRPIANTRAYILDGHRRPVPVGLPGELWLGGDGLALGYMNRPDLTAEKFIADPLGNGLEPALVSHRRPGALP